jgi:HAD superfamily hydrolase (TIGR01549 family)
MAKPKLKARAILFDLDGTIVDSKGAYREALRFAFAELGRETFDVRTVTEMPRRFEQNMPIEDLLMGLDAKAFREIYLRAYYRATASHTKPFPNVAVALETLSEKAKLALTTRRHVPKKEIVEQLEKFGLAKHFQHIITAQDTLSPKPSPEALLNCSRRLDVEICDCLVVGDSVVDMRAGKNAGAKTVAVLSGIFSRDELERENPDLILESVRKLPDFLE